ncbi:MurR/RpiR family transcriptional regulator [Pseudomonas sp. R2.Fl]|nr:MurR/RpiR family transcriptional regulator [Pseudomonas sp. R2.Fl]
MTIKTMLLSGDLTLTPAEEKISAALLADYPSAGLGSATSLARRAGVSDPTVGRLAVKLGFDGYPAFQAALLAEVEARLHSPLLMMEAKRGSLGDGGDNVARSYLRSVIACLEKTLDAVPPQSFERMAKLVMDRRLRVTLVGGRFSRHVAAMLAGYISHLRPDVRELGALAPSRVDELVDFSRNDVLLVFDYRRYQHDVIAFARQAAEQGARILLFTDPWRSPVAEIAEVTVMTPTDVASPFDTLASAVAQIEAFAAHLLAGIDDESRQRIEALETIRHRNAVTVDDEPSQERTPARNYPGPKSQCPDKQ